MRFFSICLLLLALATPARGQEGGFTILRIGTDAAAAALGDAYVAHSRDAFSTYWNPAGLAAAHGNSVGLSYHAWLADLQTYAVAARFAAGPKAGLGLFVTTQGTGDLEQRDRAGDPNGFFDAQYMSLGLAYGRAFGPVRAGVTAKYLGERLFTEQASGYGIDLGLQADLLQGDLQLGAALQNLGRMNDLALQATELPTAVRVGAAGFPLRIRTADDAMLVRTMLTAEVVHTLDATADATALHAGLEARVADVLDLRAGYLSNNTLRRFTFGLGLETGTLRFDYAFVPFQNDFSGAGHLLTLGYRW